MIQKSKGFGNMTTLTKPNDVRSKATYRPISPSVRMIKRLGDIILSSSLLLLLSPLMMLIAVAIWIESGGPILFNQERVGQNRRRFKMHKFRSMVQNAEALQHQVNKVDAHGNVIHKQKNDPRITRVGRFIRKTSLDELPQLFNVLKGEMSLVGPRPEMPWMLDQYEEWQMRRFDVPGGITGWWQVNGRSDKPMHLNTHEDLYYIDNYSLWLDFLIVIRTPFAILMGKGAY